MNKQKPEVKDLKAQLLRARGVQLPVLSKPVTRIMLYYGQTDEQ